MCTPCSWTLHCTGKAGHERGPFLGKKRRQLREPLVIYGDFCRHKFALCKFISVLKTALLDFAMKHLDVVFESLVDILKLVLTAYLCVGSCKLLSASPSEKKMFPTNQNGEKCPSWPIKSVDYWLFTNEKQVENRSKAVVHSRYI